MPANIVSEVGYWIEDGELKGSALYPVVSCKIPPVLYLQMVDTVLNAVQK
ncbi:MAG: hypothetical protein ABFC98_01490 [Candidatus Cloacimonas sp.]